MVVARIGLGLGPLLAGLYQFFNILTNWWRRADRRPRGVDPKELRLIR
jgi:hypothetical protein